MSSIVISGDTSGTLTLAAPAVSGTNTATLPAATGTVMVSGNMPAFSAYQSTAQSMVTNTVTKVQLQTEEFDTANAFDNATNYRFTPLVAGYYQINGRMATAGNAEVLAFIYKNGTGYKVSSSAVSGSGANVSSIVYLNGSTDYVELYGVSYGVTQNTNNNISNTWFNGSMVRSA